MSKIISIMLVSLLCTGLLFSSPVSSVSDNDKDMVLSQYQPGLFTPTPTSREDVVYFTENFDNGIPASWTTEDLTDPGSYWYSSEINAFDGNSWRLADSSIGGYRDNWYQVLDTPVITLPPSGNMVLSFEQFRAIEELGSHENFDGWDGLNVRIRLKNDIYENAVILTDCSPAYNATSLYSFGAIHLEDEDGDPGIPGWGGSTDWTHTTLNIPANFAGEEVIISFAFASDGATSTLTNPELSGVFLDDIDVAGVFFNDGSSTVGFTGVTNTEIGGDLWHAYTDDDGSTLVGCFNPDSLRYNPNMENYLTTQILSLPLGSEYALDFTLSTSFDDLSYPECDYFSVEVKYATMGIWTDWNSISNPTGDPNIPNVIFTGSTSNGLFSNGWPGYNTISMLAGHPIQFRFGMHSNNDQPETTGIILDDFQIIQTHFEGSPPTQLKAELTYDHTVKLNWEAPIGETVLGYKIYSKTAEVEEYELIFVAIENSFEDSDATRNTTNFFAVSAILQDGDTDLSEPAALFIPSEPALILGNDDGSSEQPISTTILHKLAAYIQPINAEGLAVTNIYYYLAELNSGPVSVDLWQDDNGLPGDSFPGFPISINNSELHLGWNFLTIPLTVQPLLTDEAFFAGIDFFLNSPALGFDLSSAGFSFENSFDWQLLTDGEIMVRVILDSPQSNPEPNPAPYQSHISRISNYPNPFNPETTIYLTLDETEDVTVQVFNLKGQMIKALINEQLPAGNAQVNWNGKNTTGKRVASGMYFYKIITKNEKISGKMLLLK